MEVTIILVSFSSMQCHNLDIALATNAAVFSYIPNT